MLSCVQLFSDPIDCSPSGSSVHGILQARILERVAVSASRGSSQLRDQTCICSVILQGDSLPLISGEDYCRNFIKQIEMNIKLIQSHIEMN